MFDLSSLKLDLTKILCALVDLARLNAMRVLASGAIDTKLAITEQFSVLAEQAMAFDDFLWSQLQIRPQRMSWGLNFHPRHSGVIENGKINSALLRVAIDSLSQGLTAHVQSVADLVPSIASPVRHKLQAINALLPIAKADPNHCNRLDDYRLPETITAPKKVATGPHTLDIDPAFLPEYSLLDQPPPAFGSKPEQAAPYFWTLAMREAFACDLCALSSVEYDGLPLAFYRDMAKQSWDEARHAHFYFQFSKSLFLELQTTLAEASPLRRSITKFCNTGAGLPVQRERNFYESFFNATLSERLVMMQVRTETPAIKRLTAKLDSPIAQRYPRLRQALLTDRCDEKSHSRIGWYWLKYLHPDVHDRKRVIEHTDLMRAIYLLTAFSEHGGGDLHTLCTTFSEGGVIPAATPHA